MAFPWTEMAAAATIASVAAAAYYGNPARKRERLEKSHEDFRTVRQYLGSERPFLTQKAFDLHRHEGSPTLTGMLAREEWCPDEPLPESAVGLQFISSGKLDEQPNRLKSIATSALPYHTNSDRYDRYSDALLGLAPPGLFDDQPCYRFLEADLRAPHPKLSCSLTSFFRAIDYSEAAAHEFARTSWDNRHVEDPTSPDFIPRRRLKLRMQLDSPLDTTERVTIFSVSSLTIRDDPTNPTFFLHRRDAKNVAIAGNLLHLAPSGVFQPTANQRATIERDFSLWLTLCREFAEEFLNVEEAKGQTGIALSYDDDEPYRSINDAYSTGEIRFYICGIGLDPLTLCPEVLGLTLIAPEAFDRIFGDLTPINDEGRLQGAGLRNGRVVGFPFEHQTINELLELETLSPAARASLTNAQRWHASVRG
jgi:hypothetical protein